MPNSTSSGNNATSMRGSMFQKMKSSRRSLPLHKRVKSKAADLQLQDAAEHAANVAPSSADLPGAPPSVADHSVGEDTTMLYPTINRGRLGSRDPSGADDDTDFDGYSIDGMSGIASASGAGDGFSSYGGSAGGLSHDLGGSAARRSTRGDVHHPGAGGEPPRDFDSVWGDDDQSRITTDGGADAAVGRVRDADKGAYVDLTKNLDELVERIGEEGSQSRGSNASSTGGDVSSAANLHEFDSESESGSTRKGAFTLELLGKGTVKTSGKSAGSVSPSQDDEDSILGGMYPDEAGSDEEGSAAGGEGENKVPSSGDSVDSTPSWAAPIQSALRGTMGIFRATSPRVDEDDKENDEAASNQSNGESNDGGGSTLSAMMRATENKEGNDSGSDTLSTLMNASQEQRTKEKFVSSLSSSSRDGSEDGSVGSAASAGSVGKTKESIKETTASSSEEKALGLTNSMEDEVDEDPAAMIDNINSMLSECREILDTEQNP